MKTLIAILLFLSLTACWESSESAYDRGYDDGYAAGYNTTCKIRATMVAGDWDNKHYSKGYDEGYSDGAYECRNKSD